MELCIKDLTKEFKDKRAVDRVNWTLTPGIWGLLGANGAGKTTLMRMVAGLIKPSSGTVEYDNVSIDVLGGSYRSIFGYLPQEFGFYPEFHVQDYLDYMAALKGLRSPGSAVSEAISQVNLEDKAKARIRTLSGGQRQRVGIAQALLGNPSFLIFDEPTVGLDPEERIHFRNLFSRTAQERLVLLSTHIIEDVQSVCDQIVVIHSGVILFSGTPAGLIESAQGHVGVFWEQEAAWEDGLHITARVNTSQGIRCRAVADQLPSFVQPEEPTLEDAYLYLISREVAQ